MNHPVQAPSTAGFMSLGQPCWHCNRYIGIDSSGTAALCADGHVQAMPQHGCTRWAREPGADDEPDRRPQHNPRPGDRR